MELSRHVQAKQGGSIESRSGTRVTLALLAVATYVLLADRLYISVATGGRGVFRVMPVLLPAIVFLLLLLPSFGRDARFIEDPEFRTYWAPYLILTLLFTFAGVAFTDYPPRTLIDVFNQFLLPLSLITAGYYASARADFDRTRKLFYVLIVGACVYGVVVHAAKLRLISAPVFEPLLAWDVRTQQAYRGLALFGRAMGTYVNPNMFGVFAVLAFWYVWYLSRGWARAVGVMVSMAALFASVSRGAFVALAVSGLAATLHGSVAAWRSGRFRKDAVWIAVSATGMLGMIVVFMVSTDPGRIILTRLVTGFEILSRGPEASGSLMDRLEAWALAWETLQRYPLGTFGSPEYTIGSFVDNEILRTLVQGSVLYLAAGIWMIWGGVRNLFSDRPVRVWLAVVSVALVTNMLTAQPLTYTPTGLYWLLVGVMLGERTTPPSVSAA